MKVIAVIDMALLSVGLFLSMFKNSVWKVLGNCKSTGSVSKFQPASGDPKARQRCSHQAQDDMCTSSGLAPPHSTMSTQHGGRHHFCWDNLRLISARTDWKW